MTDRPDVDAVVVGSGPNGLAAALTVARAGRSVLVLEAADRVGGGLRSADVNGLGTVHDLCAAFFPFAVSSPFFATAGLERFGLRWLQPDLPLAHPLDGGRAAVLHRSIDATAGGLGDDAERYRERIGALAGWWDRARPQLLGPPLVVPRRPWAMLRFGLAAAQPATGLFRRWFDGDEARALMAGSAAHAFMNLGSPFSSAVGLALTATAHQVGWPVAAGGSGRVSEALVDALHEAGGEIETGRPVTSLADLPRARATFLDLAPRRLVDLLGDRLSGHRRRVYRRFRHGPAAFKVDYDLSGPIPWSAADCRRAGTVHVGGTLDEITSAEAAVVEGRMPDRPFVLVGQQSLVDPTRAPGGGQTAWVYAHVPHGYAGDATAQVEAQLERFAPGFGRLVVARTVRAPAQLEAENPNNVGGDVGGGSVARGQMLRRPVLHPVPYRTGVDGYYLCSASTPPGGGVHGLCGWHAARAALGRELRHP